MPVEGNRKTKNIDGEDKDVYTIAFSNGALKELEDLQKKLKLSSIDTVVKLSIALLTRLEEANDKQQPPTIS